MSEPHDEWASTDFERALRGWAERPSRLSTHAARLSVLDRLPANNDGFSFARLAPAAALITLLLVAGWLGFRPGARMPQLAAGGSATVLAQSNVVVFKLDATTTLYFVLDTNDSNNGGVS